MQLAAGSSNCPFRYVNFSIAVNLLRSKSMDWCLYDNGLRLERVNESCESTATVNVSINAVHFKESPLNEVKLNFGNLVSRK